MAVDTEHQRLALHSDWIDYRWGWLQLAREWGPSLIKALEPPFLYRLLPLGGNADYKATWSYPDDCQHCPAKDPSLWAKDTFTFSSGAKGSLLPQGVLPARHRRSAGTKCIATFVCCADCVIGCDGTAIYPSISLPDLSGG